MRDKRKRILEREDLRNRRMRKRWKQTKKP
jgi:hypothetical protein